MIQCPSCHRELDVAEPSLGKEIACPHCGKNTVVPGSRGATVVAKPAEHADAQAASPSASSANQETGKAAYRDATYHGMLAEPQGPDELGRLGRYRILRVLGKGGMGTVFLAEDSQLKRSVALKTMLPEMAADATAKKRFLREAQAAAGIKHRHVIVIHEVGEDRDVPFLAMEFLEGESLEDRLKRAALLAPEPDAEPASETVGGKKPAAVATPQPLPLPEVFRIGREMAEGLRAAHERGLIHRDIKPLNIWLEQQAGGPPCVKILDFGLARLRSDASQITEKGDILGTLAYMAPEQMDGAAIDQRCDLFSLGCTLYRMCTGKMPNLLYPEKTRPPGEINPEVPPELAALVMQLMARNPDDRPTSAQVVCERLAAIQEADALLGKGAFGKAVSDDTQPPGSRNWLAGAAASLLLLAVGGVTAFMVMNPKVPADQTSQDLSSLPVVGDVVKKDDVEPKLANRKDADPAEVKKPMPPPVREITPAEERDWASVNIVQHLRGMKPADRPYARFFSLNHLRAGKSAPELIEGYRKALASVVARLAPSSGSMVAIDGPAKLVFAVDVRELGLDKRRLLTDKEVPAEATLFDLLLLEYPYGVFHTDAKVLDELAKDFLVPSRQARPIACVRADWFVHALSTPPLSKEFFSSAPPANGSPTPYQAPLNLRAASAELYLSEPQCKTILASFKDTRLAPLLNGGAVSRADWEQSFHQLVRKLEASVPMVPLDGLGMLDIPSAPVFDVELTTSKKDNVFAPGDEAFVFVANRSKDPLFIELIGTSVDGKKVILTTGKIKPGAKFRFPRADQGILIGDDEGKEQITLFASDQEFAQGDLLRGTGNLADRVVHRFYGLNNDEQKWTFVFDPSRILKKTIAIETKRKGQRSGQ